MDFSRTDQQRYNRIRKAQSDFVKRELNREEFIKKSFERALDNVERRMFDYYMRYAKQEGISFDEARSRVSMMDVRDWEMYVRDAVKNRDLSPEANKWLRLYNAKQNISREQFLKSQLEFELVSLYSDVDNAIVSSSYFEYMEELRVQSGSHGITLSPDIRKNFERIINADFYGANFSERIWARNGKYEQLRASVFDSLSEMMLGRGTYKTEVRKMQDKFQVAQSDAFRLIRTETRRMNNESAFNMYTELDFSHYVYVAEQGACSHCAPLGNKIIKLEDAQIGYNYPVIHPNCLCSTYGVHLLTDTRTGRTNIDEHEAQHGTVDEAYGQINEFHGKMKV